MESNKSSTQSKGVEDFYRGKIVLLTGTTGFIGKVMLEKLLYMCPTVGKVYILIRKKKGLQPMERFKKEVLGSKCFDRVKKKIPNFDEYINTHVRPVSGDLLEENLGLDKDERKEITDNVNVIINCAASVDFNSRLDEAIKINVYGTLKMFYLAKDSKNIENFVHVSTCYVNSDKKGLIQEKIYDISIDAEEYINTLYKKPVNELVQETPRILGNYPNTYTFTKSMAERILKKKRGDLPLTIVRPSVVGASYKDPSMGWIDTVTAASAIYLLMGIGIMKAVEGNQYSIADQVPCDYVGDVVLVSAATYANKNALTVVHAGSSAKNPVTWKEGIELARQYWKTHPPEKRIGSPSMIVIKDARLFQLYTTIQGIPAKGYSLVAKLTGNTQMKKNAERLVKITNRTKTVSGLYKEFASTEWIFASDRCDELYKFCTPDERKEFLVNIAEVDWKKYFQWFAWGLHRHILKEEADYPTFEPQNMDLLYGLKGKSYFDDVKWAINKGYDYKPRSSIQMKSVVMSSGRIQKKIEDMTANRKNKTITPEQYKSQLVSSGNRFCDKLLSTYSMPMIRFASFLINKMFKQMFEKIVVDESSLAKIAKLDYKTQGPIVIMPTHRSFVDFILVSYIFFAYKMKCPNIAAQEEFLDMTLVHHIFRASGAFFLRKKKVEHMELYEGILYEYIQRLLLDESWLEFFIEGTRSRYGKTLAPKLDVLNIVTDTFLDKKVPDIQIIPVTINYDRVIEAETFPYELLGDEKLRLSLIKFLGAYKIFNMNFGRVYLNFCEPMSMREYTDKYMKVTGKNPLTEGKERPNFNLTLAKDVLKITNDNIVIMPTSIIASILLLHRKGINEELLASKADWLVKEIKLRGGKLSTDLPSIVVKTGLAHLDQYLERKKDVFHPSFSAKQEYKNIILLSYYRNILGHLFFNEALVACSLASFGYELGWKEGVTFERLWEKIKFLQTLIGAEYLVTFKLNEQNIHEFIDIMMKRKTLATHGDKIKVASEGEQLVNFLCGLLWPLIESYWVSAVYLYTLKNREKEMPLEKFELEIQGFAESMFEERTLEFYEACAVDTIRNALHCFKENFNLISGQVRFDQVDQDDVEFIKLNATEEALKENIFSIQNFMKTSLASTMDLPISIGRKSILVDFPFMSRL